ncbi:hypothetical protein [Acuticoccus mangrovi]|uniref:N,N-dimethylformamidase alpha subunit domain-containing protein n=1 Tax=Acuticoccus mangrovi TaxID=2796142 RepID=A0A934ISB2_9HYPH|nr:hypothetical protein [Acuticoccus mangrovi]MBJ3776754.1 hypothetical protein [Acuticoccus mangrovi]
MVEESEPTRLRLVEEWCADPYGKKGPELQALLDTLRLVSVEGGKPLLVETERGATWHLAVLEGEPPRPRLLADPPFHSQLAAEWVIFRRRWASLYGTSLDGLSGPEATHE